jgi:hypothetical protein
MQITQTIIRFPGIELNTRDAHKLRGYFGNLFREHSPLLHNHYESGELRYQYPLVQYKVISSVPTLVAINEGAELLTSLFLKIAEININGKTYHIQSKNIETNHVECGYSEQLYQYRFNTLWMALNQNNFERYTQSSDEEKHKMLCSVLTGNILSFFKGIGLMLEPNQRILVTPNVKEKSTLFKNRKMTAFSGIFTTNALLPGHVGLGKAVSRGFGAIEHQK